MHQFAIFFSMAFFYTPCAPTKTEIREVCQIKAANIESYGRRSYSQVFDDGDVRLYEIPDFDESIYWKWFKVRDDLDMYSAPFRMSRNDTVVTKNSITIGWLSRTISLFWNEDGDTFEFYQKFWSLEDLSNDFRVTQVFQDDEQLDGVTVIKSKKIDKGPRLFVALHGDEPRLIFPDSFLTSFSRGSDGKILIELNTKPKTIITIEFENSTEANGFYNFVMTP